MVLFSLALVAGIAGLAAYIRLAPSDPARWHAALPGDLAPDCTIRTGLNSASAACLSPLPPAEALARIDAVALATPRTIRLAGGADQGRITWVTRSLIWGFPDYTTAQATAQPQGSRIDFFARSRFGRGDMGVNAARLSAWIARFRP